MAAERRAKRQRQAGEAPADSAPAVEGLFGSSAPGEAKGLDTAFSRLFAAGSSGPASAGGVVSAVLTGRRSPASDAAHAAVVTSAATASASSASGARRSSSAGAEAKQGTAAAAAAVAARLLRKGATDAKTGAASSKASAGSAAAGSAAKAAPAAGAAAAAAAAADPEKRREQNARTLFVGNVPLDWDQKRLRTALRTALGEKYTGAMKPIWFRSEPLEEGYSGGVMRKVGSLKRAYSKYAANAKNAYVLLDSAAAVRTVRDAVQGLSADKDHVLRLDGVGESAQLVKFDRKRSVFVGNLPTDASEADLRKLFAKVGTVDAVRVVRDKVAAACKGFAFVRFSERSAVKAALELWDAEVRGRTVRIMKVEVPESEKAGAEEASAHPAADRLRRKSEQRHRRRVRKAKAAGSSAAAKAASKKKKGGKATGRKKEKGMLASKKRKM
eukprot:TRINITY_DN30375_c0_g2_i1.p1 TRINITY_DN30375_c0_g2~~TRINITY_DN30375_c0_g2_i1.p1  ORF type:complete len:443 (-),score=132.35 TRINITY_DN30375_c0_g2_i1:43-1371(-)